MKSGSIRVNLLAWLIIPGLLVLGIGAWLSYEQAFRLSNIVTDQQLTASARMIAEQVAYSNDTLLVTIPPAALELFASESHDEVAYAVTDPAGTLIAGYPGLDTPAITGRGNLLFFETTFRDEEPMRAVDFLQTVVTPTGGVTVRVSVGETLKARNALVTTLWMRGFLEQGALVIAGAISIWLGISHELAPLLRLRQEVRDRRPDQFEPFDTAGVQTEIRPLVQALNAHMDRLRQQLERQRRFLDSAAHQLRTPLAVIKTQVNYALRARERSETDLALAEVDSNLTSMARMTSQLLTLGGVDHNRTALQSETIDLSAIAHQVVLEAASRALDAGIEMAFDSDGPAQVAGSDVMLVELVTNLVENVIAHAGPGSEATIAVRKGVRDVILRVEDTGEGASDEDRTGLLQRFRRGKNARPGGSGLGLSIVSEIVETMGGTIELPVPRAGKGFAVEVRLPAPI
jgi:two-component system sensor histidine kinase TctE